MRDDKNQINWSSKSLQLLTRLTGDPNNYKASVCLVEGTILRSMISQQEFKSLNS